MDNKIIITFTENKGGVDVVIDGRGDNNLLIKAIKSLGGLGENLKNSIVGKGDQLLARIALYNTGKSLTKDILVGVKAKKIRRKSSSDTAPDYVETHYTSALGFGLSLCKGQDGPHPWGDVILEQNINPISSGARA